ncbi:MAG: hypothetical protein A2045_06140 [Rhodocyclales bacterium GWA2_65_20]|nr:MAG: hypothetical protein A2045_06140 [Rhodocyclales bacterium GWA2_65_20]
MNRDQYLAKRELFFGRQFAAAVLPAAGAQIDRVGRPLPAPAGNFAGPARCYGPLFASVIATQCQLDHRLGRESASDIFA